MFTLNGLPFGRAVACCNRRFGSVETEQVRLKPGIGRLETECLFRQCTSLFKALQAHKGSTKLNTEMSVVRVAPYGGAERALGAAKLVAPQQQVAKL